MMGSPSAFASVEGVVLGVELGREVKLIREHGICLTLLETPNSKIAIVEDGFSCSVTRKAKKIIGKKMTINDEFIIPLSDIAMPDLERALHISYPDFTFVFFDVE